MPAVLSKEILSHRVIANKLVSYFWAVAVGVVSGFACVAVRLTFRGLQWILLQHGGLLPNAATLLSPSRRLLTPAFGAACATAILWTMHRWGRVGDAVEYVEAVRFEHGHIPFRSTVWRTASSAFSVASGAAIGREGSMIQFAAATTSWFGHHVSVGTAPLSRQVAYGTAAAVAAVYHAPLAGILFALEIVLGEWLWAELPQIVLASCAGWAVSRTILGAGPLFAVTVAIPLTQTLLWTAPLAIGLGVCGPLYQKLLRSTQFMKSWPAALIWSGLAVGALGMVRTTTWGNGDGALQDVLKGQLTFSSIFAILVLRLVATTLCVGTGTVGGVFTPTLFAGAALGLITAHILHLPPLLFAIVGLASLMSAVTHAPFMAILMAVELTGQYHLLPLLLPLGLLSWQIARWLSPRSLYAIATPKPARE